MLLLVLAVLVRTESFLMTREQRQVRVSRQGIDRATSRSGGCAERRRQQLERMAGSQKPFVRLVASARCKNNCIKWPRTETGLERFSHLVRESCNELARLLQFSSPWPPLYPVLLLGSARGATGRKPVCRSLEMQPRCRDGARSPLVCSSSSLKKAFHSWDWAVPGLSHLLSIWWHCHSQLANLLLFVAVGLFLVQHLLCCRVLSLRFVARLRLRLSLRWPGTFSNSDSHFDFVANLVLST